MFWRFWVKKIRDLLTLAVWPGSLILLDCEGDAVSWRKQDMGTFFGKPTEIQPSVKLCLVGWILAEPEH